MTLVEFLLARIAEDEAAATGAVRGLNWDESYGGVVVTGSFSTVASCKLDDISLVGVEGYTYPATADDIATAKHIVRWDPARVLAECTAKKAIIEDHGWQYADPYETWKDDEYRRIWGDSRDKRNCTRCGGTQFHPNLGQVPSHVAWPCPTLRFLAAPWSGHPDFNPEWTRL